MLAVNLAAVGARMLGGDNKLLDLLLVHPLEITAGHLTAQNIEELTKKLRKWRAANERVENEDLERAVTRSKLIADLSCLLDALPLRPSSLGPAQDLWDQFRRRLGNATFEGIVTQAEVAVIQPAIADCHSQLNELQHGIVAVEKIDPQLLVLSERGGDWATDLAFSALSDMRARHANLPERVDTIFKNRWFSYLCLAFHEQIKANANVRRVFTAMQVAAGFAHLEDLVREEGEKTRDLIREIGPRREALHPVPNESARAHITISQSGSRDKTLFSGCASLVRLGRSPASEIVLPQPASWEHGRIVLTAGVYIYEHLGKHGASIRRSSGKQVRLSSRRRSHEALRQLDEITLTDTFSVTIHFSLPDETGYTPTTSSSHSSASGESNS
jgi:hypothetical protein